jgi:short subunit dehydrogenase-like uncharacterized protein
MTKTLIIYGASGYTGTLISRQAKQAGLDFVVAGRDKVKLAALAEELGVPYEVFSVDDPDELRMALSDYAVLLNCAGPFARTAQPIMDACIDVGVHYLDITAEFNVYLLAETLSDKARNQGTMLLPGVGWDVVPSDCLAVHTAAHVKNPKRLRIALQVAGSMSRGSAISAAEIIAVGLLARTDGAIVSTPDAKPTEFNFGEGYVACYPLSFGDLVTAWHSTGIPNIEMFVHVTGAAFPDGDLSLLPDGPSDEERNSNRAKIVVEVTAADGTTACSMIETINGYSYTPLAAVEAARRVLSGEVKPGFTTPATLFGPGFASTIADTRIIDL